MLFATKLVTPRRLDSSANSQKHTLTWMPPTKDPPNCSARARKRLVIGTVGQSFELDLITRCSGMVSASFKVGLLEGLARPLVDRRRPNRIYSTQVWSGWRAASLLNWKEPSPQAETDEFSEATYRYGTIVSMSELATSNRRLL